MHDFSINPKTLNTSFHKEYLNKINSVIKSKKLKTIKKYQVFVMAAGKGSRMDINYPKPIYNLNYPYGTNSLIGNILFTLEKVKFKISSINIIINKNDEKFFHELKSKNSKIQLIKLDDSKINGTANCLYESIKYFCNDKDLILLWGDLAIFPKYILNIAVLIKENFKTDIVFPTKIKMNPYVSFLRNKNGNIDKVLHSNEGNSYKGFAEQDCSCFVIDIGSLNNFKKFIRSKRNNTKSEIDFIHFIPYLNSIDKTVFGIPIVSENYATGINTINKTKKVQSILDGFTKYNYLNFFLDKDN